MESQNKLQVCKVDFDILKNRISELLIRCYAIAGIKQSESDHLTILKTFLVRLNLEFRYLSIYDVEKVCEAGASGYYGDFYGINCLTLCNWLRLFKQQAKPQQENLLAEKNPPSEKEVFENSLKNIKQAFEEYKQKNNYNDSFNICYNFLDRHNKIPFTAEKKKEFMELAKPKAEREVLSSNCEVIVKKNKYSELLEQIQNGKSNMQVVIAKKLALNEFFKGLVLTGMEIDDLFNANNISDVAE